MHCSSRCDREGTAAEGASLALLLGGFYGLCFLHLSCGSVRYPLSFHRESPRKSPRQKDWFGVAVGTVQPWRSQAGKTAGLPQPSLPSRKAGRTVPGIFPCPTRAGKGPQESSPSAPSPGCGALRFPGEGGREGGRRAAAHLPSGQGGGADTGNRLRPRPGHGETKSQGRNDLMEGNLPPFPAFRGEGAEAGPGPGAAARERAAFEAAALDTHVGLGARGWK